MDGGVDPQIAAPVPPARTSSQPASLPCLSSSRAPMPGTDGRHGATAVLTLRPSPSRHRIPSYPNSEPGGPCAAPVVTSARSTSAASPAAVHNLPESPPKLTEASPGRGPSTLLISRPVVVRCTAPSHLVLSRARRLIWPPQGPPSLTPATRALRRHQRHSTPPSNSPFANNHQERLRHASRDHLRNLAPPVTQPPSRLMRAVSLL